MAVLEDTAIAPVRLGPVMVHWRLVRTIGMPLGFAVLATLC